MAATASVGDSSDPLAVGIRRIRRIAPPRIPFAATRAVLDGDERVLLVDVDELIDWAGWQAAGAQHLIAPSDLVRRETGHDAVVEDLRAPLARVCAEREAGAGWSRGEAVTVVVSLLRGVSEAIDLAIADSPGEWWISAAGRPVFVFGVAGTGRREPQGGPDTVAVGAAALVGRIAAACDDRVIRRIAEEVREALSARTATLAQHMDRFEAALFDAAAPQAVADGDVIRHSSAAPSRVIDVTPDEPAEGGWVALREALARHVDSRVGDLVSSALARLGAFRRERRRGAPRTRRRGVFIAAALAGAAVLAVGLLWPGERAVRAEPDDAPVPAAAPTSVGQPAAVPGGVADGHYGDNPERDPLDAARGLFTAWDACGSVCGGAGADVERTGSVAASERDLHLVDDYGAMVLISVTSPGAEARLVVLERSDDGWRVREIYRGGVEDD